jgi:hypothetical protein
LGRSDRTAVQFQPSFILEHRSTVRMAVFYYALRIASVPFATELAIGGQVVVPGGW